MDALTIKCRDLMVGDWIADNNGFKWQITVVGDDYAYATFEGNEADPWELDDKDDQPQPIEITEDILIKNGWRKESDTMPPFGSVIPVFVKDEGDTHLELKVNTLIIWFNCIEGNQGVYVDVVIPTKYVHQLQGALRIAGLTDMANNFKI